MKLIILACAFVVAAAQFDNPFLDNEPSGNFDDTNDGNNDFNSFEDTNPRNSAFFPPSIPLGRNRFRGSLNLAIRKSNGDTFGFNTFRGRNAFDDDAGFDSFETGTAFSNSGLPRSRNRFDDDTDFDDDIRFDNRFDDDVRFNGNTRFNDDTVFDDNDDFDFFEARTNLRGRSIFRGRDDFDDDTGFDDDFNDDDDIFARSRFSQTGNRFRGNGDFGIFGANEVLDPRPPRGRERVRGHPDVNALISTFNVNEPLVSGGRRRPSGNRHRNSNLRKPLPLSSRGRSRTRGNLNFQSFENDGDSSNAPFNSASHEEFRGGVSHEEFRGGVSPEEFGEAVSREELRDGISREEFGRGRGQDGFRGGGERFQSGKRVNLQTSPGTGTQDQHPPSQLEESSDQKKKPGGQLIFFHIEPVYKGLFLTMKS